MLELILFLLYLFVFIFGICIGSFLNVVVYRVPNGISIAKGRSFCPTCKQQIKSYDLIPILSFLFLGRKCRYCKQKISFRYPLVELFTGIMAVLLFVRFDFTWRALAAFVLYAILIAVALIDLDTMTIPNGLVLALVVPAICAIFLFPEVSIWSRIIGFFVVSVPMLLLAWWIDGCFGGGDIKLMAVCGFLLGWQNALLATFIGILLGGLYAVFLLLTKRTGRKDHIAFGPFLAFGVALAFVFGTQVIGTYLSWFGLV